MKFLRLLSLSRRYLTRQVADLQRQLAVERARNAAREDALLKNILEMAGAKTPIPAHAQVQAVPGQGKVVRVLTDLEFEEREAWADFAGEQGLLPKKGYDDWDAQHGITADTVIVTHSEVQGA